MFRVNKHDEYSEACFERDDKPENRDLCISVDFNALPSEYGKGLIRIVMDGMSNGDGKEAVELAAPVLYQHLVGRMMTIGWELALYIEQCVQEHCEEEVMLEHLRDVIGKVIFDGLDQANRALRQSSKPEPYCTISVAVVFYRHIYTANMGDSPIYLLDCRASEGELEPLFVCDNEAAELISFGALTEEEALHTEYQSRVRRFLGYKGYDLLENGEMHFRVTPLPRSCVLMLGSDGALSQLTRQSMAQAIRDNLPRGLDNVREALQNMVEESGSVDDFTLLMDRIDLD